MKRSEAYCVITKFIKSGIARKDCVERLKELRTQICSGKEINNDNVMAMWVLSHESWIDENIKNEIAEMVRACHAGFAMCDEGINKQCIDCPYNQHFSWE